MDFNICRYYFWPFVSVVLESLLWWPHNQGPNWKTRKRKSQFCFSIFFFFFGFSYALVIGPLFFISSVRHNRQNIFKTIIGIRIGRWNKELTIYRFPFQVANEKHLRMNLNLPLRAQPTQQQKKEEICFAFEYVNPITELENRKYRNVQLYVS